LAKQRSRELILIVEDEPDIRQFISRVLELEGHRVLRAEDGEEGLKIARANPITMLLLDLRMPGQDGWMVLKQMKSSPKLRDIPVIMLTASVGEDQQEKAFSMGAADYLVKPLSAASLKKAVARVLKR
jgi:chemosensory pili system protein ChpA (sensor histidine kinase/response regulator)